MLDRTEIHGQSFLRMALLVEHDSEVVERPSQVVPGFGIIGELAHQALAEGQSLAVCLKDQRDLGAIVLTRGLSVVSLSQVATVSRVLRIKLDQFFIDSDCRRILVEAKLARGEPGQDVTLVGLLDGQCLVD